MATRQPQYISAAQLDEILHEDVRELSAADETWWASHSVRPFAAAYGDASHFVVALAGLDIIFFADDEDEFGVARLDSSGRIIDYGLAGDLKHAVAIIRTKTA
jgi:hypothetical protein